MIDFMTDISNLQETEKENGTNSRINQLRDIKEY